MTKTTALLWALPLATLLTACDKLKPVQQEEGCARVAGVRISGTTNVAVGQMLDLSVHPQAADNDFIYINWYGPNNLSVQQQEHLTINDVNLPHSGWYYVHVQSREFGCEQTDSVLVNVTMPLGTAPCNQGVNTYSFSNMGGSSFTSVRKTISQAMKVLEGQSLSTDVTVQFHPYWVNREPADGMYDIYPNPYWSQTDNNASQVYVSARASSLFFQANTSTQKVYVSHVNGKLQAQVCGLSMSGGGFSTQLTTTLREP